LGFSRRLFFKEEITKMSEFRVGDIVKSLNKQWFYNKNGRVVNVSPNAVRILVKESPILSSSFVVFKQEVELVQTKLDHKVKRCLSIK
jgi:hypothetical protein